MQHRMLTKIDIVAVIGELIGTTLFLFFGYAGVEVAKLQGRQSPDLEVLFYISATFGASLMFTAWIFFRISGGLFNPAVSVKERSNRKAQANTSRLHWRLHFFKQYHQFVLFSLQLRKLELHV